MAEKSESGAPSFPEENTVNVLVLELATMVVAIAIAFGANFLATFDFSNILYFVFTTSFVIWFWWGYVMDRLEFPPKSLRYPFRDVLVLILISLIPFALRQRDISSFAGTLAALLFVWGFLIDRIVRENTESLPKERRRKLRLESLGRVVVGLIFALCAIVGRLVPGGGLVLLFLAGVVAVAWTTFANRATEAKF